MLRDFVEQAGKIPAGMRRAVLLGFSSVLALCFALGMGFAFTNDPSPAIWWFGGTAVSAAFLALITEEIANLGKVWRVITTLFALSVIVGLFWWSTSWISKRTEEAEREKMLRARESLQAVLQKQTPPDTAPEKSGGQPTTQGRPTVVVGAGPSASEIAEEIAKRNLGKSVLETHVPAPKLDSRVEILPIFKTSPLFTVQRKARITREVNAFYHYLVRVGFEVPKEMPPLGVEKQWSPGKMFPAPGGTAYDAYIYIPANLIDKREMLIQIYSGWIFSKLFPTQGERGLGINERAAWLYSDYYRASFLGKYDYAENSDNAKWKDALWDIRKKHGQEFTDKLLLYTFKRWKAPNRPDENLNTFYWDRILAGVSVIDNDGEFQADIVRILQARGIKRSE